MTPEADPPTVLVVDDEPEFLEAYERWLADHYEVRTASDGDTALGLLDESVDVVLLDRRMPGLSGDDLLSEIRRRGFDCRVAIITAVVPEIDIVDLPFDEYLVKPVSGDDLRSVVETLKHRATLDAQIEQCYALASKITTLEANLEREILETSERYQRLKEDLERLRRNADETLDRLIDEGDVVGAYSDIER